MVCFLAATTPAAAQTSIHRLADAFAREVQRVAAGRPAAVSAPEDRTGRGGALSADLLALINARLPPPGTAAVTLRMAPVLAESRGRLTLSSRVLDADGAFVDVVTASVAVEDGALVLYPTRSVPAAAAADVLLSAKTPWEGARILDLALLGTDRLLVLTVEDARLFGIVEGRLEPLARYWLPGPFVPVRHPGGLVAWTPGDRAAWVMTSRSPRAVLLALEGDRLVVRETAAAVPWPGVPGGLRFRDGTNLLEMERSDGPVAVLSVERCADDDGSVTPEGVLQLGTASPGLRVGPAIALLGQGMVAAAAPTPPGVPDHIRILKRETEGFEIVDTLSTDGTVAALAALRQGGTLRLAAALEGTAGARELWLLDLGLHPR